MKSLSLDAVLSIPYFCFPDSRLKCRDGATSDFGIGWFIDSYVIWGQRKSRLIKLVLLPLWYGNKDIIRDTLSWRHR